MKLSLSFLVIAFSIFFAGCANKNGEQTSINNAESMKLISSIESMINNNPENPSNYIELALNHKKNNNYKKALKSLTKSLEIKKTTAGYIERGIILSKTLDYKSAINDFNEALKIDPSLDVAYVNRGLAFLKLEDIKSACSDFKAVRSNNTGKELYMNFCE